MFIPKTDWITDVRSVLRREHGKGWLIEQQSGRIKICLAVPGQRRQAITTNLSWAPSSATKLTTLVGEIRDRMESLKLGLAESYRLLVDVPEGVNVADYSTVIVWCESFGEFITAAKYQ